MRKNKRGIHDIRRGTWNQQVYKDEWGRKGRVTQAKEEHMTYGGDHGGV